MGIRGSRNKPQVAESDTRYLYYWLLLALFFEYARPLSFVPPLARLGFLYSVVPLLLMVFASFSSGLRPMSEIFADSISKWILIFLGLVTLSVVHADVTSYVFETFKTVLGYVFLFLLIARIATTMERWRGIVVTLVVAHVFLLAMNPAVVTSPDTRHYILGASFLGDGNDFSLSLCLLAPLLIEIALAVGSRWKKLLAWGGVALMLLAIIGTQSRGASLGMAAVLVFLWTFSSRKMISLVGVAAVGIVVLIYAPPAYFQRMNTIGSYQEDGSAQGRIEAWKASINMAVDNPLLGVGAGHFPTAFGTKYRTKGAANMPWLTAHSSYFLVLGELGIPGVACLLALVIGNIRANGRLRRELLKGNGPEQPERANQARMLLLCSASAVGLGVAGAFLSAAYYPHFYVLTGLLVAARSVIAKQAGIELVIDARAMRRRMQQPRQST